MNTAVPVRRKVLIEYLRELGVTDARTLAAMAAVPRETFVPATFRHQAYEDYPLEIGEGQTISQPSVVARITQLAEVKPGDRVLEIGAGSGYQAAVLAHLARFVFTLERLPRLAEAARARLTELGYRNVSVQVMDGTLGWRAQAPFDAIIVSAAAPSIPRALTEQLTEGGRLVIPIGELRRQELTRVVRHGDEFEATTHGPATFVPLVGREGYQGGT